jgi:outer membrane protein TolC
VQGAGRVSRADVLRQDAFLARTELDLRRARVQADVSQQQLHQLMTGGEGKLPAWKIGEDVLSERPGDNVSGEPIEALQNEAIKNRLEIQALENTVYALKQKSAVERSQGYPRLEGFGNLTYANPNQFYIPPAPDWNGSWDVGIRLTWTLNDLGSASAVARTTDSDAAQIRIQRQQLADQLRTEVLTSASTMEEASLARESAHRGLEAAQASYDDRVQLFQHGRATSLDLLESESALLRARLDLIQSYLALRMARVRFDHAVGRDVQ